MAGRPAKPKTTWAWSMNALLCQWFTPASAFSKNPCSGAPVVECLQRSLALKAAARSTRMGAILYHENQSMLADLRN